MANQIVLAWTVDCINTSFGPTAAAAALAAVPLYVDPTTDPVLGQMLGLTVSDDSTIESGATTATRTLTLNMTAFSGPPFAPPPFPCHPITATPPVLPYPLRSAVTLAGSFFVSTGSFTVQTSAPQISALNVGDAVQFLSQQGVFYTVAAVGATTIGLTAAYSGPSKNTGAFKEVAAPTTRAAIYSSSDLDTAGVSTVPAISAGPGARVVELLYLDSTGAGPFATAAALTGKRPAAFPLAGGSIDIATIVNMLIVSSGGFGNSVGELTLVELSSALPAIPANATPKDFVRLTDEAQLLIGRALAYLPPSYFALAQQGTSAPELTGDFLVTTGSANVPTTSDQTGALAPGDTVRFASQPSATYVVSTVTPKLVTLTGAYTGLDTQSPNTGFQKTTVAPVVGTEVENQPTGARKIGASTVPTNDQLSVPLAQFVAPETAAPPPNPPLDPSTVPSPTFLSGFFTRTLQLALAGVPITSATITFV